MRIIAYAYTSSTGEIIPNRYIWGWEIDEIYQDLGDRPQLNKLLSDCQRQPTDYLLIRTLEELGDSLGEVCDRLQILEVNGVKIIALENSINYQDQ
ncbi:MAG: recombinase family protein, partial [Microcoleaceae cyanobacterium]